MENYFRSEILESKPYRVEYYEGIKINQNECPWDVPIDFKVRVTERLLKMGWNRYPVDEVVRLQKKLAMQNALEPDQFVLSNGSNTLIQALINVIDRHNKVMVLDPTFVVYELQAQLRGNRIIKVPLSEDFELQTERMITTIKKEKPGIIFIANPNAPTGTLFEKRCLYRIIQAASCPVVIDEAYYPFTEETAVEWLLDFSNLIILRSFSKAFALAGVRCGYMISSVDIAKEVEKFLLPFRLSTISCAIIDEALDNSDYMRGYVREILKERARVFARMQKIEGLRVYPSEANFLLFRILNGQDISKKLMQEKVLIRKVDDGALLKDCYRVSIGTPEENDKFIAVIKQAMMP